MKMFTLLIASVFTLHGVPAVADPPKPVPATLIVLDKPKVEPPPKVEEAKTVKMKKRLKVVKKQDAEK